MSEKPISPLRRRMIEDMTVREISEKTQSDYIRHIKNFTMFLGRSPDTAEAEDLRRFQVHQRETGITPPTMNGAVTALRFFFKTTLGRPDLVRHLTLVRQARRLRNVLSPDEVLRLLEAAPGPKYKTAFGLLSPPRYLWRLCALGHAGLGVSGGTGCVLIAKMLGCE